MSQVIVQGSTTTVFASFPGGTAPYVCYRLHKGDTSSAAPSLGTTGDWTLNGLWVDLDGTDTDTEGPLWAQIQDNVGALLDVPLGVVWNSPIGYLPNDQTAELLLARLDMDNGSLPTVKIACSNGALPAVVIDSAQNGISLNCVGHGIDIKRGAGSNAIRDNATDYLTRIANALLDLANGIETGYTLRQMLRLSMASLMGKSTLAGGTRKYRNPADTKDRITATTDVQGQRLSVTLDPS